MLALLAIASAKAMVSQGAHALAADAKAKAAAPAQVIGVGPNGAMTDESDVQLRAEAADPLGPSAASMLAMPALDGPVSADVPSLEELEASTSGSTTASTTAAGLSDAISRKKAEFDSAEFADSMQDLLDVAPAAANTTELKAPMPMDADALAKAAIGADLTLPDLDLPSMPLAADPHGSLSTSAIQAKQTAKAAQWTHALKSAAQAAGARQLSDDDHWATEALRTTGGIVATIDDDYPYQCHCSRKSSADQVSSGNANPVTPGSLSESGRTLSLAEAEAKMKTTYSGVCTHHPDQECMAIPGDHAALLSVAVLALLH